MAVKAKHQYLPPELVSRFENLNGDALDNLEESIGIQKTLETRLHEQLATGESFESWRLLNELVPAYECSDPATQQGIFNRMKQVIHGGLKTYGVRKEIQSLHESQRRLTETLVKARKEVQETYTAEMWAEMLNELLTVVRLEADTETQKRIALGIQARQRLLAPQGENESNIEQVKREAITVEAEVIGGDESLGTEAGDRDVRGNTELAGGI